MSGHDPFEVFARVNPFAGEFGPTPDDERRLTEIIATPVQGGDRRGWWSRRRIGVTVGLGVAVLATAAFAVTRREQASDPTGTGCYASAALDGDIVVLGVVDDPVAACSTLWSDGTLGTGGVGALTACVNEAGVAVVFPDTAAVCSRLGLGEYVAGRSDEQQALADLHERMAEFYSADCYRQADAITTAQQLLDESGLEGWTVELAEDFPPGLDCGVATPITDLRTVIVGGARPAPPAGDGSTPVPTGSGE